MSISPPVKEFPRRFPGSIPSHSIFRQGQVRDFDEGLFKYPENRLKYY
jgi:hypothetical protein